jgi:NADH-quinone oxidoreductase subunit M
MALLALLLIPFATALLLLVARPTNSRPLAMAASLTCTAIVLYLWGTFPGGTLTAAQATGGALWGLRFVLGYDGIGLLMLLLTGVIFPFIVGAGAKEAQDRPALVNGLLLLAQSFLFGVFSAQNAFLFYIFYELALLPLFFLLLFWGGDGRRAITMRFFMYTLLGGLSLLLGITYCVVQEPSGSADLTALGQLALPASTQKWLFWVLFIAFAIKLPIFPFHAWQPDTYTVAPVQGTMALGGVLLKMGLYGVVRLIVPLVPTGMAFWRDTVIWLSLAGALYAAWIAFRQTDLKRLVAYSSLSHVGVLCAGIFARNAYGMGGALYQAFAHAVLLVGLLYVVSAIQRRTGTTELTRMGGLKLQAPRLAALFFLVLVNAVALPLTQSFVGEWLMFNGLWQMEGGTWMAVAAVCTIVLGAVYMLYAFQRAMLGPENKGLRATDADATEHFFLVPLIAITLLLGVYPAPILDLVQAPVNELLPLFQQP